MTIAPNGVTVADYDPTGVGSIVFAAIYRADHSAAIQFGDIVVGADVNLRPACVWDHVTAANNVTIRSNEDAALPGSWRCLGYMALDNGDVTESASLFMRVA